MGQYHTVINLSRRQELYPPTFGSGSKLMEFGHDHGSVMGALVLLCAQRWAGDRIAILGDYGEPGDLPAHVVAETGIDGGGYKDAKVVDASAQGLVVLETALGLPADDPWACSHPGSQHSLAIAPAGERVFICNLSQREFLDPAQFGSDPDLNLTAATGGLGGVTTALAVLLAASSVNGGRGGGDFTLPHPLVGWWAGDRVSISSTIAADDARDISVATRQMLIEADESAFEIGSNQVLRLGPQWCRPSS